MFDSAVKNARWVVRYGPAHRSRVVVALRERKTGKIFKGQAHEQHADLREREGLGRSTEGWLEAGFIDLDIGDFLTRGEPARRFPLEAGRTRGRGCADSSDFPCIREARQAREAQRGRDVPVDHRSQPAQPVEIKSTTKTRS